MVWNWTRKQKHCQIPWLKEEMWKEGKTKTKEHYFGSSGIEYRLKVYSVLLCLSCSVGEREREENISDEATNADKLQEGV